MDSNIKEKILKGEEYSYFDKELNNLRTECKLKCFQYNCIFKENQKEFIKSIINVKTDNYYINKKFDCHFGKNIFIGDNFYSSFNLTIIDDNLVIFGDNIYIGPNCIFNTIKIPLDQNKRAKRIICSNEIKIGNNVYFEGAIIISNGISIGNNVIIKANSIIDKNIPDNCLVEGNPCKIIQSNISFNFNNYIKNMINNELTNKNYIKARNICDEFNNINFENFEKTNNIIKQLFKSHKSLQLTQKAYIQNGNNTTIGEVFYTNYNFILIDSSEFNAGNNVFFAPNCIVNTNIIEYNETKKEYTIISKPINLGNNIWIASNVYIKGGISIGDNSTIGAGSVVISDIPNNCIVLGNPGKVFKKFDVVHNERIKNPNDKRSEKEISLNEELYFTGDEELTNDRIKSFKNNLIYNSLSPDKINERKNILKNHLGNIKNENFEIDNYFNIDYGYNFKIGNNFKSFFNLNILDENEINIGDNVTIGPNVSILCATHPIEDVKLRNSEFEYAKKISIGNNVWIKGNVVILPGIKIGNNVIIENGSIVTRNIPDNSYASGVPCRVLYQI